MSQQPVIVQQLVTASNGEVQQLPVSLSLNTLNTFLLAYDIVKSLYCIFLGIKHVFVYGLQSEFCISRDVEELFMKSFYILHEVGN